MVLTFKSRYKEFSLLFYTVLMEHADDLQAVSVDAALIDVTATVNQMREQHEYADGAGDPAKDYAETIRNEIRAATTCEGKLKHSSLNVYI